MKHTLAALVENTPGTLMRIAGLFARRGFNIESLSVGATHDPTKSRMTIVVDGDERTIEQVSKQLNKLINVIKVSDLTMDDHVAREIALVKIHAPSLRRYALMQIVEVFRGKVIDIARESLTVEMTGDEEKVQAFLELAKEFGIKEVVRTGKIAMARGSKRLHVTEEEETDGKDLLRRRRGFEGTRGQASCGSGLRQPRACASAESK
ncbi:MAG TPA: acetolactate synthase small subunit [Firmicutes bacterium]|nr:acetolactate synthase small subunit [Bacillota bacterium]